MWAIARACIIYPLCTQESCRRFWPEKVTTAHFGKHAVTVNEVQCEEWDTYNLTVQAAGGTVSTCIHSV